MCTLTHITLGNITIMYQANNFTAVAERPDICLQYNKCYSNIFIHIPLQLYHVQKYVDGPVLNAFFSLWEGSFYVILVWSPPLESKQCVILDQVLPACLCHQFVFLSLSCFKTTMSPMLQTFRLLANIC